MAKPGYIQFMNLRELGSEVIERIQSIISRFDPLDPNQKFIKQISKQGFKVKTVYDIGAYKGSGLKV